jgi:threonine synthase
MLSPHGRMSPFQPRRCTRWTTQHLQPGGARRVRRLPGHRQGGERTTPFKARYRIGAVNSINWARVAAQVVYYFKGYFAPRPRNDEQVSFCGALGQLRQHLRRPHRAEMGLPIAA